jgi:spore coat polysaccharide biosynthesis protein SpsF
MVVTAIIQARTGSSRLPGKVMLSLDGEPAIRHEVRRAAASQLVDEVFVATSDAERDDVIERAVAGSDASVFRGDEADVLGRIRDAAASAGADHVLRLCGDNTLIPVGLMDELVRVVRRDPVDYASSKFERTFPTGMNADAFSFSTLDTAAETVTNPSHREHVAQYFKTEPAGLRTGAVVASDVFDPQFVASYDLPAFRVTLDELSDYRLLFELYDRLEYGSIVDAETALRVISDRGLDSINNHVQQAVW